MDRRRTCYSVGDERVLGRDVLLARGLDVVREPLHVARALLRAEVRVARPPDDHVELRDVPLALLESHTAC